jgi:hypothetical protein
MRWRSGVGMGAIARACFRGASPNADAARTLTRSAPEGTSAVLAAIALGSIS